MWPWLKVKVTTQGQSHRRGDVWVLWMLLVLYYNHRRLNRSISRPQTVCKYFTKLRGNKCDWSNLVISCFHESQYFCLKGLMVLDLCLLTYKPWSSTPHHLWFALTVLLCKFCASLNNQLIVDDLSKKNPFSISWNK